MAKRKRKMTLFDVMHSGQPIGLQVRTRVPAYQRTPELPVTKKLAKLFGRADRPDPNKPKSAADELEALRRELGAKSASTPPPEAPAVQETVEEPTAPVVVSSFKTTRERMAEAFSAKEVTAGDEPRLPAAPRRSMRDAVRDRWELATPKLEAMTVHLRTFGGRGLDHAGTAAQFAREMYSQYAVTAAAAAGVVILLCGSFYAGKLLFNRPAVTLANASADTSVVADTVVHPDVLDIAANSAKANEALANVSDGETKTKLERTVVDPTPTKSGVFGGRRTDINYVIVQSYFTQAEADATVEVLNKYGLKTSVEMNLPRWAMAGKNLYSVVSIDGFAKMTGNADFQAFMNKLATISDKEAGTALPKKLDPRPYRLQPQG